MANRPKIQGFGSIKNTLRGDLPNTLNSFDSKAQEGYNQINQALEFAASRFGGPTSKTGQAIIDINPDVLAGALGIKFGSSKTGAISGLGRTANAAAGLGSTFDTAKSLGISPEEYGGIPQGPPKGPSYGQGLTGRQMDEQFVKSILDAEARALVKVNEKTKELEPIRQQVQEKFGFNLGYAEVAQNRGIIEEALKTDIPQKTFGSKDYTLEGIAQEHNILVNEFNTTAEQIEKEQNPLIANRRVKEQLEPTAARISELQSDYEKVGKAITERTPRTIEVGDYGRNPNRFKDIKVVRERIAQARDLNIKDIGKDPYKKQAVNLIDERNYQNIEKQLVFEEKAYKKAIGNESVNRGASQVPQTIGGSGQPPIGVPIFPTQRQQKSNMLAGLPTNLMDIGMGYNIGRMSKNESRYIRQPKKQKSFEKFFDFDFGGF